ncbi:hypothetical protein L486_03414 [Kwoniella mangroviensis CBS 10435]|uniref:Uncharacterized protein n=1 Tax=Kwoniella mangroviensis CBS 10435 TaxID=1331196 RepID=A0A1B9ITQ9_9TREE|nr:hypothetical protein L486_03414 [Kwoniella mangroviensis CBS 10435]
MPHTKDSILGRKTIKSSDGIPTVSAELSGYLQHLHHPHDLAILGFDKETKQAKIALVDKGLHPYMRGFRESFEGTHSVDTEFDFEFRGRAINERMKSECEGCRTQSLLEKDKFPFEIFSFRPSAKISCSDALMSDSSGHVYRAPRSFKFTEVRRPLASYASMAASRRAWCDDCGTYRRMEVLRDKRFDGYLEEEEIDKVNETAMEGSSDREGISWWDTASDLWDRSRRTINFLASSYASRQPVLW